MVDPTLNNESVRFDNKAAGAFQARPQVGVLFGPAGGASVLTRNPAQSPAAIKTFNIFPFFVCIAENRGYTVGQ